MSAIIQAAVYLMILFLENLFPQSLLLYTRAKAAYILVKGFILRRSRLASES